MHSNRPTVGRANIRSQSAISKEKLEYWMTRLPTKMKLISSLSCDHKSEINNVSIVINDSIVLITCRYECRLYLLEATNLQPADDSGLSDPYIKVVACRHSHDTLSWISDS